MDKEKIYLSHSLTRSRLDLPIVPWSYVCLCTVHELEVDYE